MYDIRKLQESDTEGFQNALASVVRERKFLLTLTVPSIEDTAQFLKNGLLKNHPRYVAEYNGEIVGWADLVPGDKEALRHVGLLGMGVVAEHRNRGLGRNLLNCVIEQAWESGLTRLELEVFCTNTVAVALYESTGFEHEGIKRYARYFDGRYEDIHIMAQCRT